MSERAKGGARDSILAALRADGREPTPPTEPPDITGSWLRTSDSAEQRQLFARMLEAAGGRCQVVATAGDLPAALAATPEYAGAERRVSLLPGTSAAEGMELPGTELADLTALAALDFALLPGVFGVAENGAVWVDGDALPQRSLLVLPQHLGIVVSAHALVDHMHAAYERLTFARPGFGCFVSGPSKTADIEQALVIGAHGARSLSVFLLEAD